MCNSKLASNLLVIIFLGLLRTGLQAGTRLHLGSSAHVTAFRNMLMFVISQKLVLGALVIGDKSLCENEDNLEET